MRFKRLFEPITINKMELKNRIIMPALHHKYTPKGYASPQLCEYYNKRAEGGAGLIIIGGMCFDGYGGTADMASLADDKFIEGYKHFTNGIHERGAKVCAQLYHSGRYAKRANIIGNEQPISASSTYSKYSKDTSREMTLEEIKTVQKKWAEAAVRAQKAGFDAVEIIACSGYLIPQFLSELTNKRTDEYGGSFENRSRFGREVAEAVREAVGADYPILMRLAGNDFMDGGGGMAESIAFAKVAEKAGIDLLNITGGWHESSIPQITGDLPRAGYTYLAHAIKKAVSIPVAASNRMNDPSVAEEVLAVKKADMVCLGRVLVADPEWPLKVQEGRLGELRKCVACNQGCLANSFFQKPLSCLINGMVGREYIYADKGAPEKTKNILVVGGGPGGAEFAIQAAMRGHKITLWEKAPRTGGQLPLVAAPSGKREFHNFISYQAEMMKKYGVTVVCNKEGAADEIIAAGFDTVVVATGVIPNKIALPNDEGLIPTYTAHEVLSEEIIPGKNIVIVGGGSVGCEIAHIFAERAALDPDTLHFLSIHKAEPPQIIEELLNTCLRNISIVEIMPKIGAGFDPGAGWPLLKDLKRLKVARYPTTHITAVGEKSVTVEKTDKDGFITHLDIPCDTIILAVGSKPNQTLYHELEGKIAELYPLGDSKQVGKIINAVQDAVDLAMNI